MKFFRWLLSNLIMIIIIIGLMYSYAYWGNLTGSDTPAGKTIAYLSDEFVEVKEFVDGIKAKSRERNQVEDTNISTSAEVSETQAAVEPVAETDAGSPIETDPAAVESGDEKDEVVVSNSAATESDSQALAGDTNNSDEKMTGAVETAAPLSKAAQPASEQPEPRVAKDDSNAVATKQSRQVEPQPVTINYSQNQSQVQQDSDGAIKVVEAEDTSATVQDVQLSADMKQADVSRESASQDSFVTPEIEKELETASADGGVAALTPDATRSVWIDARKSFYRRDYEESEKRYKRVISMTKDNYDAYGELGNVYFHQGKNDEAAAAYLEASIILINVGEVERAKSLLGLMRFLDKEKAALLKDRIEAAEKADDTKT